jgi:glycosyltransferase involved in cell wall biosynthesis
MSIYNETEDFIFRAISSMLCQTYPIREFVIVFDNPERQDIISTVKQFVLLHNEIEWQLIVNEKNKGLAASLNRGIRSSKYQYIARMDADDESLPDRLKDSVHLMLEKKVEFIATKVLRVDEEGEPLQEQVELPIKHIQFPLSVQGNRCVGMYVCCVKHPTWLFSKSVWEAVGGYREELFASQDYDFLLRAFRAGYDIATTSTIGLRYTVRDNSVSGQYKSEQVFLVTYIHFYMNHNLHLDKEFVGNIKKGTNLEYNKFRTHYVNYKQASNWLQKGIAILKGVCVSKFFRILFKNMTCAMAFSIYYGWREADS